MRRTDREVTSFAELTDILRRADTIRLGMHDEPYPYVVPLSFAFEAGEGKIALYFHGAQEGLKHCLLARNPHVCVEADIFHGYAETSGGVTTKYESLIGFGKAERVYGEQAAKGLDLLLARCGYEGYTYDTAALEATAVYRIEMEAFTGKRSGLAVLDVK